MTRLPKIIEDAAYRQFSVTKWDILDKNSKEKKPERLVLVMIASWLESILTPEELAKHKDQYKKYPTYFASEVVMKNSLFPNSIPIGYVLKCFWKNVPATDPKLKLVRDQLNSFLLANDNRVKLFDAYEEGEFFIAPGDVQLDEVDGEKLAGMLYGKSSKPKKEPVKKKEPKPQGSLL